MQEYINNQNNRYWIHRIHEVPLHPMKVDVLCAVSARRIIVPVLFDETINFKRYLHVEGQDFQHHL
jgi:hypothetical protein